MYITLQGINIMTTLILPGSGGAVLQPHNRGGPRAADADDALWRERRGIGAADLAPVSTGAALLALQLEVCM